MNRAAVLLVATAAVALFASGCTTAAQPATPTTQNPTTTSSTTSSAASTMSSDSAKGAMMGSQTDSAAPVTVTGTALDGQKIFLDGMTPSGPVKFTLGSDDVGNGACANCHGKNAGGGDGPMIMWSMLSAKNSMMENMPKFSYSMPDQVVTTIVTGTRPDGTKLKNDMPRYQLSPTEAAAVVDYLKALR